MPMRHYGIVVAVKGNEVQCIEYDGSEVVKKSHLSYTVRKVLHRGGCPVECVVRRAESAVGEKKYHQVFNNCETFARWCLDGKTHPCQQVTWLAADAGCTLGSLLACCCCGGHIGCCPCLCGVVCCSAGRLGGVVMVDELTTDYYRHEQGMKEAR